MRNMISEAIEQWGLNIGKDEKPRNYIGASSIGHECWRKIWYEFNGYEGDVVPPKVRRTWSIGHHLESLILDWIGKSGFYLSRINFDLMSKRVPIFMGHVDAIMISRTDSNAIVEIKTAKDSSFKEFVKKGVKLWRPIYYSQIQSYMGMSETPFCWIVVLNKDTSELSDERVEFNEIHYQQLEQKALVISESKSEPPRLSNSPIFYACKMCKFNKICHEK